MAPGAAPDHRGPAAVAGLRQRRVDRGLPVMQGAVPPSLPERTREALESVRRSEEAKRPNRLGDDRIGDLLDRRLVYVCAGPRGRFAHLTRRGALALGLDPKDRV